MYLITITLAKLLKIFIQLLNLGAGYTWSGHLALKLYPNVFKEKDLIPTKGLVFITGTNGKTTTTKMLSHVLRKNGRTVVTNDSGANLLSGILTSLLLNTSLNGKAASDFGIFEVDEFTLPLLLKQLTPHVLILLNLSRDQLDRYGETDTILERWFDSVKDLPSSASLLLNANQEEFSRLTTAFKGTATLFNGSSVEAAAFTASITIGIDASKVASDISDFSPAWGRGESIKHLNFLWKIYLAKNPASFNYNLDLVSSDTYLFIFNDNIPDGRDVSWIYDISTQKILNACKGKSVYISGKRAFDMAVRLQYAGVSIDISKVIPNVREAVLFVENGSGHQDATVLANYSAMLELRKVLLGRSIL